MWLIGARTLPGQFNGFDFCDKYEGGPARCDVAPTQVQPLTRTDGRTAGKRSVELSWFSSLLCAVKNRRGCSECKSHKK